MFSKLQLFNFILLQSVKNWNKFIFLRKFYYFVARLCNDSEAAVQVAELQGVSRLVRLCREENERNNNDSVLACCLVSITFQKKLASMLDYISKDIDFTIIFKVTLRKITQHCGLESVKRLDASELVEPQLLESILLYSSKQFNTEQ